MRHCSSSRMGMSRSSEQQQQHYHHRRGGDADEGAAEAFDLEAQQPERRMHEPLQQQRQHGFDYYHYPYCEGRQEQAERKLVEREQPQDPPEHAGEQRLQQAGPRNGSRSRSGSSAWWEPRLPYSSVVHAQAHASTPPGSSDSSTASSSRSRERRFLAHTVTNAVQHQPSSNDSGAASCGSSSRHQQSGKAGSSGKEDEEEEQRNAEEREEELRRQPLQPYKQATLQRQQPPQLTYYYRFSSYYQQPEECGGGYLRQQEQETQRVKHQQSDWQSTRQEEDAAHVRDVDGFRWSRAYHRRPHKRHSFFLQQQQHPVNGKDVGGSPLRGSPHSRFGAPPYFVKLQESREKKLGGGGGGGEDEEAGRLSRRRFESYHQQQQGDGRQGHFYGFRSNASRWGGHGSSQAVVYQWQRRVVVAPGPAGEAQQQQQEAAEGGEPQHLQEQRQQAEGGKGEEQEEREEQGTEKEEQKLQLLDENDSVESEAETYDVLCGIRRQRTGGGRLNGCIPQHFFSPREDEDDGEEEEEDEEQEPPQQQQQKSFPPRQQETGRQQQQHRPPVPWPRPRPPKFQQQRLERQQQQLQQLLQRSQQHFAKPHVKHAQKQYPQKHYQPKQKQQQLFYGSLSRSISPTALEEGQQAIKPKFPKHQQRHFEACLGGADEPAAASADCLLSPHNLVFQAEEAVCAWLFDILVAHLEGCRGQPIPPESVRRMHREHVRCPAFVTWMKKKRENSSFERVDVELRGCIGSLSPIPVLEIGEYALTSALRDKRFRPIALREVPHLACYLSLLHSYEDVKHPLDWEIGVHGTTIKFFANDGHTYTATYLPEVAKELGMTQRDALTSLIRKSGYPGVIPENFMSRLSVTRYRSSQARLDYDTYLRRYGRYASP